MSLQQERNIPPQRNSETVPYTVFLYLLVGDSISSAYQMDCDLLRKDPSVLALNQTVA